jgi:hypothetical protein
MSVIERKNINYPSMVDNAIENYAYQKWWQRFYIGWSSALVVSAVSFVCSYSLKKGL